MDNLSTTFRVGQRWRCSITIPLPLPTTGALAIDTRWEPSPPGRLTASELADYRRGRNALLAEAARLLGAPVVVAEI